MILDGEHTRVNIRLAGDEPGASSGIVEMSVDGRVFRPVCTAGFGQQEARVFCGALGFDGYRATFHAVEGDTSRFAVGAISCPEVTSLHACFGATSFE